MGRPAEHIPVKLIAGLISQKTPQFLLARQMLEKKFGSVDMESVPTDFACTRYYEKEFGEGLKRKCLSFKKLISLKKSYAIKLYTNRLEKKLSQNRLRSVNIDPGYLTLTKLLLFTTKNRSHRVYLDRGIYADLELTFANNAFGPMPWTYPDYRTRAYIDFFNAVRKEYARQIHKYLT